MRMKENEMYHNNVPEPEFCPSSKQEVNDEFDLFACIANAPTPEVSDPYGVLASLADADAYVPEPVIEPEFCPGSKQEVNDVRAYGSGHFPHYTTRCPVCAKWCDVDKITRLDEVYGRIHRVGIISTHKPRKVRKARK